MVEFDQIPDAARQKIAQDALPLVARHDVKTLGAPGETLMLGNSLQEEMLPLGAIVAAENQSPQPTGQTFSLLQAPSQHSTLGTGRGNPPRFVGHVIAGPGVGKDLGTAATNEWSVTAVSSSDLSARIQEAIEWIDVNVNGTLRVRVLSVPAYQVTALTLYEDENLVGIVALPRVDDPTFERNRLYSLAQFIERLRQLPGAEGLAIP